MEKIFRDSDEVSPRVVAAASWAWRLLIIFGALYLIFQLLMHFADVTVPIAIALLLSAALFPIRNFWMRRGLSATLASVVCVLGFLIILGGVMAIIGAMVIRELPQLGDQILKDIQNLTDWLSNSPYAIDKQQIDDFTKQFVDWANNSRSMLAGYVAGFGSKLGQLLAGAAIVIITCFFFLKDSKLLFRFTKRLCPKPYRNAYDRGVKHAWTSLVAFMRATVSVAFIDALGVLIACLILGTPLPWAIFAFTFIACFIPVVGAFLAGAIATLLTLVAHGPIYAIIMLVAVILVMNIEGNFLQPLLLGRAVELHPLAVILGLTLGAGLAGIVGALLAGPTMAFVTAYIRANSGDELVE